MTARRKGRWTLGLAATVLSLSGACLGMHAPTDLRGASITHADLSVDSSGPSMTRVSVMVGGKNTGGGCPTFRPETTATVGALELFPVILGGLANPLTCESMLFRRFIPDEDLPLLALNLGDVVLEDDTGSVRIGFSVPHGSLPRPVPSAPAGRTVRPGDMVRFTFDPPLRGPLDGDLEVHMHPPIASELAPRIADLFQDEQGFGFTVPTFTTPGVLVLSWAGEVRRDVVLCEVDGRCGVPSARASPGPTAEWRFKPD